MSRQVYAKVAQALRNRTPFHSGICTVPDHQLSLYYSQGGITHRRLDFSKAGEDELEALYRTCKPATFGRNGENSITQGLFTCDRGVEMELYKLNVDGKDDFFKPHKDTPRRIGMVGSLVVVLPTQHEGGQFVLRKDRKEWTIDFAEKFAAATEPSICFVAFFGDVEHEVLPVTSGYRVTLTYNLYYETPHATSSYFPSPVHRDLKEALVELHEYACSSHKFTGSLVHQLKGPDQILADVCDELNLRYSLKLLYKGICGDDFDLLTVDQLQVDDPVECESEETLWDALHDLTIDDAEGIEILGRCRVDFRELEQSTLNFLSAYYRRPPTQVLELWPMSSVGVETPYVGYGNEASLDMFYGTACMMVAIDPAESRKILNV
ncbi:hypothetical protein PAXINDRAFT_12235 [Paxillus involutus ATCC 200175]|uniref:Fe2OG dioxygenase domain-containing protein n=1 Tax=Paxillus involutus ATCC 200175 TaxID=664439 RepID=A0A0C9U722_PAXIN|nr:hypothetical protein PAXINDRAFT_12235 [Paxillus involutus ATCC 200175]